MICLVKPIVALLMVITSLRLCGAESRVQFATDIQPILAASCYECHGPEKQKGGLRLDQKAAALRGGDTGPLLVPGKSADSL